MVEAEEEAEEGEGEAEAEEGEAEAEAEEGEAEAEGEAWCSTLPYMRTVIRFLPFLRLCPTPLIGWCVRAVLLSSAHSSLSYGICVARQCPAFTSFVASSSPIVCAIRKSDTVKA